MEEKSKRQKHVAWLQAAGDVILFAESSPSADDESHLEYFTNNAVAQLIHGINIEFGVERFRYLRKSIMTNYELTDWEKNLIKVCAKRYCELKLFEQETSFAKTTVKIGRQIKPGQNALLMNGPGKKTLRINDALKLAKKTAQHLELCAQARPRFSRDRAVVALLLDANGRPLMAARNTNHESQMLHAEVNLFLSFLANYSTKVPKGYSLVSSLKPCRMCASLFLSICEDPGTVKVFSCEDDGGRFGRHHLLGGILTIGLVNE